MITEFLIGFIGALTGGVVIAGTVAVLYAYERSQKNKQIQKILTGFQDALAKRSGKGQLATLYPENKNIN